MRHLAALALSLLVSAWIAPIANANTIVITSDWNADEISKGGAPWSASCTGLGGAACIQGLQGPSASWSTTTASGYRYNGNPRGELDILNTLLGNEGDDIIQGTTDISGAGNNFVSDYKYFAIKQSNYVMFFENLTDAGLEIDFLNEFSHVTGFGSPVSEVPLPPALWLFGSALAGLFSLRKRSAKG